MFFFNILKIEVKRETSYKNKKLNNKIPSTIINDLYNHYDIMSIYMYILIILLCQLFIFFYFLDNLEITCLYFI